VAIFHPSLSALHIPLAALRFLAFTQTAITAAQQSVVLRWSKRALHRGETMPENHAIPVDAIERLQIAETLTTLHQIELEAREALILMLTANDAAHADRLRMNAGRLVCSAQQLRRAAECLVQM
jgi:hypothetical protein